MALGRAQVLADGEHLDALLAQLAEGVHHLLPGLAEPHHQARLRRDLVAAHGGVVALESAVGAGTTVTCRFPTSCYLSLKRGTRRLIAGQGTVEPKSRRFAVARPGAIAVWDWT